MIRLTRLTNFVTLLPYYSWYAVKDLCVMRSLRFDS